ncbi:endonuclease [Vibrio harveyi]|uniref:endonuclease n=1 Tax=Vibrio harveyi TaxID=669 RepID=UPI00215D432E|nr:endonuclease [Vibrio harveyi]MCR9772131.1 endonuclease [Vibrio harveyi]
MYKRKKGWPLAVALVVICASGLHAEMIAPDLTGETLLDKLRQEYKPQNTLNYRNARKAMFSEIDNENGKVRLVYTGEYYPTTTIPDHNIVNTEHTWPQSKFKGSRDGSMMKSDLHHLYPTFSKVNSERGSKPFAEIPDKKTQKWWVNDKAVNGIPTQNIDSYSESTNEEFEPREDHKGNVARAMAYLYTVYDLPSGSKRWFENQLNTLYQWHLLDPVDTKELKRTQAIADIQGTVNPYIVDDTLFGRALIGKTSIHALQTNTSNLPSPTLSETIEVWDGRNKLKITTWNLEHMMSRERFLQWAAFCGRSDVNWDDNVAIAKGKPRNLTYCNAHSGLNWPANDKQQSLPLRSIEAFEQKISALKERAIELDSDVYAFQEVSDAKAIESILPQGEYIVMFESADGIPMQVGYAVRKSLAKHASYQVVDTISVCKTEDRINLQDPASCKPSSYRTRPGLELTLNVNGEVAKMLNVHLKSSCRSDPVSQPKAGASQRKIEGCQMLRAQVPALEDWVDQRASKGEMFILLGDFNRDFVKEFRDKIPARLDGSKSSDSILPDTQIGAVFQELNDNSPEGAKLHLEWQKIDGEYKYDCPSKEGYAEKAYSCHRGIDHIIVGDSLFKSLADSPDKIYAKGADYGRAAYCGDNARPSDHCPVTVELSMPNVISE